MIPILCSAQCAEHATLWIERHGFCEVVNTILTWCSENGSFYFTLWLCCLLVPKGQKSEGEKTEPLFEMVVAEGLDTLLRLALFYSASYHPEIRAKIVYWGSLGLDLVFLALVAKSHNLIEISRMIIESMRDEPIRLGLAGI